MTRQSSALHRLRRLPRDARGATAIEYGLILALIAVTLVPAMIRWGGANTTMWEYVKRFLSITN
ncbi:Flp family type IVb pilin [Sphingomonas sp.]|jgi:pilus assembly protein Flp/PilA|uniref:Flp family type IVb pilin n=1 Tax=Sphingomonas sp. TaxID=28214 RepID=UPI0035C8383B